MTTQHSSPESGVPYEDPEFVKSPVTEPALKPCPFCGRPGAICCLEDEPGSPASFWINCWCGMETRERRTEAEAIALWNTRAAPAQPQRDAREATLKMVAGLFEESVHETYTREEVVSIVEDMMRLGSPLTSTQAPAQCDLARITELRVFEHGGFRATVDGVGGWGSTQSAAIENATENAKKLNTPPVTSTVRDDPENEVGT